MRCPICKTLDSKVVDSRSLMDGAVIRRRRECEVCQARFTTYERAEGLPWKVIKKDGRREDYDRAKILKGITTACEKRPISVSQIESLVDKVEEELEELSRQEVSTEEIGELVMQKLQQLDHIAYVRFASVYRQFQDVSQFLSAVNSLKDMKPST
jgi:transcriptional repressor NrdR